MAKTQNNDPLVELKQEAIEHLENVKSSLEEAQKDIDALKEIGIDTSRLQERVNWGLKAREVILKRYGHKP